MRSMRSTAAVASGTHASASRSATAVANRSVATIVRALTDRTPPAAFVSAESISVRLMIALSRRDTSGPGSMNQNGPSCCPWKLTSPRFSTSMTDCGTSVPNPDRIGPSPTR